MSRYETEEEQIDAIKQWWNKNGTMLLSLLLVAAIAFSGWRYWSNTQYVNAANGSSLFELMQLHAQKGTFGEVSREALKLIQEQPESPYAVGAAMLSAQYNLEKGEVEEALKHYQWVVDNTADFQLRNQASLSQVRLYLNMEKIDEAKAIIDVMEKNNLTGAEKAVFDYIKGMTFLAQNQFDNARTAFSAVVANDKTEKNLLGLAQIQLDDLAQ